MITNIFQGPFPRPVMFRQALSRLSEHAEPMVGWPRAWNFPWKNHGPKWTNNSCFFWKPIHVPVLVVVVLVLVLVVVLLVVVVVVVAADSAIPIWPGKAATYEAMKRQRLFQRGGHAIGNMGIFVCQQRTKQHVHTHNLHMYMHASIHPSIRRCTHANIHVRPYVRPSIHPSVHTSIQTYRQTDRQTCIHTYVRTYVRTYVHTYIHTCTCTYTYTFTYTYTYTYTYIHTYRHTDIHIFWGKNHTIEMLISSTKLELQHFFPHRSTIQKGHPVRKQWLFHIYVEMVPGVGKCPINWEYWTSPKIVAIKKTIYHSWLGDVKHGDMTNDPWIHGAIRILSNANDEWLQCRWRGSFEGPFCQDELPRKSRKSSGDSWITQFWIWFS